MISARRLIQRFHFYNEAYALEALSVSKIKELIPRWHSVYQQLRQDIDHQIKRQADSFSRVTLFVELLEQLRSVLSPELREEDMRSFMEEALILTLLLNDEALNTLKQKPGFKWLLQLVKENLISEIDSDIRGEFTERCREISDLLPSEQQAVFWSAMLSLQATSTPKVMPKHAINQLSYLLHYLLKRQLAISPGDENCQMLWLNPMENSWLTCFLDTSSVSEKDFQSEKFQCTSSSLIQAAMLCLNEHASIISNSWQDVLQQKIQGLQTSLFSTTVFSLENDRMPDLQFTAITLDLRADLPFYPYQRREIRKREAQLQEHFYAENEHQITPGFRELMLRRAEEITTDKSLLLLLVDRTFLSSDTDHPIREYLNQRYQQIFIMDFCQDDDPRKEGLCALFLVSGKTLSAKGSARLMYASQSYQASDHQALDDFEDIGWGEVNPGKQPYWIKVGDSDFPDLYPISGTKGTFFKKAANLTVSLMPEWLIDDDPKLLQRKAKYLIKEYQKSLTPGGKTLNPEITWPVVVQKMSEQGIPLEFDDKLIRPIMLRPAVFSYLYAEEKLLRSSGVEGPSIVLQEGTAQAIGSRTHCAEVLTACKIFPLHSDVQQKTFNISDRALNHFKGYYQKRANSLDSNFIVFPPENITTTLDRITSISRDLPVLRKYPEQINQLLEDARDFTSDVELLSPPYEKIEEFRHKVLRLERDAIERKVIYQRVKTYIDELKNQLSLLTREYDEAYKDLEAVNKENLFYYYYAILHDPHYERQYADYLHWELPRIPTYPQFRQWVSYGKILFSLHSGEEELEEGQLSVQEENLEKPRAVKFTYKILEDQEKVILKEGQKQVTITGFDSRHMAYRVNGLSLTEHLLKHWQDVQKQRMKLNKRFQQPILSHPSDVLKAISKVYRIGLRTLEIREALQPLSRD